MINVVVETAVEVSKSQYPVIMKSKRDGLIVLFYEDSQGMVLCSGESDTVWSLGKLSPAWDMNIFEKFYGVVKLSNA